MRVDFPLPDYKMVAEERPEVLRKLALCDIFLIKEQEDEQSVASIRTFIRKSNLLNLPNKAFYCLNGIHVPLLVLKARYWLYFETQG